MLKINTPSRLHITLIDMNASLGRVDGGIGLTLDKPCINIVAKASDIIEITGNTEHRERILKSVSSVLPHGSGISIEIKEDYSSHIGLGSGTQVSLACGMAVNKIYSLGLSVYEIAEKLGRGGTSGIGVSAFENGGFILDIGHKFSEKKAFLPSAASKLPPALILLRKKFPDWKILIATPDTKGASSKKEVNIFKKVCPIPIREVERLSHIILMQMLPAVIEQDIVMFGKSINSIQETGFKKIEVGLQPKSKKLMEILRDSGAYGVGMSSFGPTIYAFGEDMNNLKNTAKEFLGENANVLITNARNKGAIIEEI